MSNEILQLNEQAIRTELKDLVRQSVQEVRTIPLTICQRILITSRLMHVLRIVTKLGDNNSTSSD